MNETTETTKKQNPNTKTAQMKTESLVWTWGKSISLVIVAAALFVFITGGSPLTSKDAYASTNEVISLEDYDSNNYSEGVISVPYTSIYDITLNDAQLLAVCKEISPAIVQQVSKELPNTTPNLFILRCAVYNDDEVEEALNKVLDVTLASDWRTDEYYIDTRVDEDGYTTNGKAYNFYGDE